MLDARLQVRLWSSAAPTALLKMQWQLLHLQLVLVWDHYNSDVLTACMSVNNTATECNLYS
jgi:hypothetical protein